MHFKNTDELIKHFENEAKKQLTVDEEFRKKMYKKIGLPYPGPLKCPN